MDLQSRLSRASWSSWPRSPAAGDQRIVSAHCARNPLTLDAVCRLLAFVAITVCPGAGNLSDHRGASGGSHNRL